MTDILVVEDNIEMGTLLCDFLKAEGYSVNHCTDGESALSAFESGARLVVLDVMLPNLDGFGVCKKVRETSNAPIIIVSAKTEKDDKLNGLILGADDYIEKPYDIDILLAKIKGIFARRYNSDVLSDGFLKIDRSKRTACKGDDLLSVHLCSSLFPGTELVNRESRRCREVSASDSRSCSLCCDIISIFDHLYPQ